MGSNNIYTRRSERLNNRWVTLATGFHPAHPYHRKSNTPRPLSHKNSYRLAQEYPRILADIAESGYNNITSDIFLERNTAISDTTISEPHVNMSAEERFTNIETEVSALKTDVGTINGKLDRLIESMAALEAAKTAPAAQEPPSEQSDNANNTQHNTASTAHSDTQSQATGNTHTRGAHGMHHAVDRQLSEEEFLLREMARDRFQYTESGRYAYSSDFTAARVMAKPYMYLSREGLFSLKHKLDARQTINPLEYVDATLALLADKRAYEVRYYPDIMHHLRKVTRDAQERPWPAVRRWSQSIWDAIEAGDLTWYDRDAIQEERVRLCFTGPTITPPSSASGNKKQNASTEVICRDFNSRQGCRFREGHGDAHIFHTHCCSYCDSVGRTCFHSIRECERRVTHSRNDNAQHQGRPRQYNNYNANSGYNAPQNAYPQHNQAYQSKNGF